MKLIIKDKKTAVLYMLALIAHKTEVLKENSDTWGDPIEKISTGALEEVVSWHSDEEKDYGPLLKINKGKEAEWKDLVLATINKKAVSEGTVEEAISLTTYVFPKDASYTMGLPTCIPDDFQITPAASAPPKGGKPAGPPSKKTESQQSVPPAASTPTVEELTAKLEGLKKKLAAEDDQEMIELLNKKIEALEGEIQAATPVTEGDDTKYPNLAVLTEKYPEYQEVVTLLELLSEGENGTIASTLLDSMEIAIEVKEVS